VTSDRQALACTARRSDGSPCRAWAMTGQVVCSTHGGRSPQAKAAAKRRGIDERARRLLAQRGGTERTGTVSEELAKAAREVVALKNVLAAEVDSMRSLARVDKMGREEVRAVLSAYERALDRTVRSLVDISRLNIDERLVVLHEEQGERWSRWLLWLVVRHAQLLGADLGEGRFEGTRELVLLLLSGIETGAEPPETFPMPGRELLSS
jgi:hypothetical protein